MGTLRLILFILFAIGLLTATIYRITQNYDSAPRFEIFLPLNVIITTLNPSELEPYLGQNSLDLEFNPEDANFCANVTNSTLKNQFNEFINGPCSPVVIVPGISASKLQVKIDCEELQNARPDIFADCGWGTCGFSLINSKPQAEYEIWIAEIGTPMTFIQANPQTSTCFGDLIQLGYNQTAGTVYQKYVNPPGVTVTFAGNTPTTNNSDSECGFTAIENLMPLNIQSTQTFGFLGVQKYLEYMGYQWGLSLFALPYDFRKTTLANELYYTLQRTIELAYTLTGKRVILAAHSMGNFGSLFVLNNMNQTMKDQMILAYVQMTPPLVGAAKAVKIVIGGDDEFYLQVLGTYLGLNFYAQKAFLGSSSAAYDLLPKTVFFDQEEEQWLKDVITRIGLEQSNNPALNGTNNASKFWQNSNLTYPFEWFPPPNETCFNGFINHPSYCMVPIVNWQNTPILNITNETFYANRENISYILENFVTFTNISKYFWEDDFLNGIQNLTNPGVPVITIYGSHALTEEIITYYNNPVPITSQGDFYPPDNQTFGMGDGTVPSTSALLPGLKWAWQFDNGEAPYPVKIVEWCASHNNSNLLYDTNYTNQTNKFLKNSYMGLNCSCMPAPDQTTDGENCIHATIMNDQGFINLFANLVKSYDFIANSSTSNGTQITEANLQNLRSSCPGLTYDRNITSVSALLSNFLSPTKSQANSIEI